MRKRALQAHFGKHAGAHQCCFDVVQTVHVAPDQAQRFAFTETTQRALHAGIVVFAVEVAGARIGGLRIVDQRDQAIAQQRDIGQQDGQREITREQHLAQALVAILVRKNDSSVQTSALQAFEALVERIGQFARQMVDRSAHCVIKTERWSGRFPRVSEPRVTLSSKRRAPVTCGR